MGFVVNELVANSFDTDATVVSIDIIRPSRALRSTITILDDDPKGFVDLSHAYTLFAPSTKKGEPNLRGRFNLGEKLVLAVCNSATLRTTTGTVSFKANGERHFHAARRTEGSELTADIPCTLVEHHEMLAACAALIVPPGKRLIVNSDTAGRHSVNAIARPSVTLDTEFADEAGRMHRTRRKTVVEVYKPLGSEGGWIYELGIPIVVTGDDYDYNVLQKVPLSMERDSVRPAYLREVRTAVLDAMAAYLTPEQANQTWVRDAFVQAKPAAIREVITKRFGDKVVARDPSDPEANNLAVSQGYTVISGPSFSKDEWAAVREAGLVKPAGQVTPSLSTVESTPEGKVPLAREKWPTGAVLVAEYAVALHEWLFGVECTVALYVMPVGFHAAAWYGRDNLGLNLTALSKRWFKDADPTAVTQLLIHEFAHRAVSNHLDHAYHEECCRLGAVLHVNDGAPQLKRVG